jgi:hypothetical protein
MRQAYAHDAVVSMAPGADFRALLESRPAEVTADEQDHAQRLTT